MGRGRSTVSNPIFRATAARLSGENVALVTLTVAGSVRLFTDVRCRCSHRVMMVPGVAIVEVRIVVSNAASTGRGRVVECRSCRSLCEVIEHAAAS